MIITRVILLNIPIKESLFCILTNIKGGSND